MSLDLNKVLTTVQKDYPEAVIYENGVWYEVDEDTWEEIYEDKYSIVRTIYYGCGGPGGGWDTDSDHRYDTEEELIEYLEFEW